MFRIVSTRALSALAALLCLAVVQFAFAEDQEEKERNKRDAVERVVESHDTTLLLGGGKLMIKQAAVRSARKLLREWGKEAGLAGEWWDDAPQYKAAKAELLSVADTTIAQRYESGVWLKEAWSEYTARELDGEEADEDEVVRRVGERAGVAALVDVDRHVPCDAEERDQQRAGGHRRGQRRPAGDAARARRERGDAAEDRRAPAAVPLEQIQQNGCRDRGETGRDRDLVDGSSPCRG